MAWTTPGTATAGEVLTAAFWNTNVRDNLDAIRNAQINVQSVTKTDVFTSSSTSYTDVTGLSVSITPSSASSKVLVIVSLSLGSQTNGYIQRGLILRGSTAIGAGNAAGNRPQGSFVTASDVVSYSPFCMTVLDSPATTASTTYKVQVASEAGVGAGVRVNTSRNDDFNQADYPRLASTITVIEVPV